MSRMGDGEFFRGRKEGGRDCDDKRGKINRDGEGKRAI